MAKGQSVEEMRDTLLCVSPALKQCSSILLVNLCYSRRHKTKPPLHCVKFSLCLWLTNDLVSQWWPFNPTNSEQIVLELTSRSLC